MKEGSMTTRGERMLALRKARMAAAPPFLRGGFRPFFFGGPLWAVIALALWLCAFFGGPQLPSAFDALAWHRHEMLFGFVGAAIAGFLLTAIPNWTGRLPIAGHPLAALFALWVAGRAALLFSAETGLLLAGLIDVGFYLTLAVVAGREVFAARNRNKPVVLVVLLFGVADALDYAGAAGVIGDSQLGYRAGIGLAIALISLIGGRIVPSFTRNWMARQGWTTGLPHQPDRFDMAVLAATVLALLAWVAAPDAAPTGFALLVVAVLQFARLARWRGWRTLADRLVLILHLGYLWIPVGLLLLGWSVIDVSIPRTVGIHALTSGAIATMILAVMTRATLGHTGRELRANVVTVAAYACVTLGAVLRVIAPLQVANYRMTLEAAGTIWVAAFVLFLAGYAPLLFGAKPADSSP
jgi:uncharacterized protein involved in response to NO